MYLNKTATAGATYLQSKRLGEPLLARCRLFLTTSHPHLCEFGNVL